MIMLFCESCNLSSDQLLGDYSRDNAYLNRSYASEIESLSLKRNNIVEIKFKDTLIFGRWDEFDFQEFHYIEILANNTFKQMTIYNNDSVLRLYFVGKATDFNGGFYDSLSFIKMK